MQKVSFFLATGTNAWNNKRPESRTRWRRCFLLFGSRGGTMVRIDGTESARKVSPTRNARSCSPLPRTLTAGWTTFSKNASRSKEGAECRTSRSTPTHARFAQRFPGFPLFQHASFEPRLGALDPCLAVLAPAASVRGAISLWPSETKGRRNPSLPVIE